ncbi:MAG TPA: alpha/beta hydrolase [Thermoanaerobaculia bacterium]|nr:alpha/beta hydrolase [Thermoanaerobaculia bacterium]
MRTIIRRVLRVLAAVVGALVLALVVFCLVPYRSAIRPLHPRASTRYWTMPGGYRIAFTRVPARGGRRGAPVIVLHGGPGAYVYSTNIATFGRLADLGRDVYLYDQVGSGLSTRLDRPKDYTFRRHLDDLHEIVAAKIGGPVVLVGQSYGAILVAHFLARHPALVERAVFTSPGALEPSLEDAAGHWVNDRLYPTPAALHFTAPPPADTGYPLRGIAAMAVATAFDRKLMSDREADGMLNSMAARFTRGLVCDPRHVQPEEGGGGFYVKMSNFFGDVPDPRPALRRLGTPALVLQGQCDFIPYAGAAEYADLLRHGEYRFVPGAGHEIWWDRPDEYVGAVSAFLNAAPPAKPGR